MENGANKNAFDELRRHARETYSSAFEAGINRGEQLDKAIISLSGGGLVFSMTFVSALAPNKHLLWSLFAAWGSFTISIISVVLAIRRSQFLDGQRLISAAKMINELNEAEQFGAPPPHLNANARRDMCATYLNRAAVGCFLLGVILLGIFVGYNLWVSK
jgi:hypothetical protein